MSDRPNRLPKNSILRNLPLTDLSFIQPLLHPVVLQARSVLQEPKGRVQYINSIETGIASLRILAAGVMTAVGEDK
jgi:hypothetical protein